MEFTGGGWNPARQQSCVPLDQQDGEAGVESRCNKLANLTTTIVCKVAMNIAFLPGWGDPLSLSLPLFEIDQGPECDHSVARCCEAIGKRWLQWLQ